MRVRNVIVLTALLSTTLGAVVAWLVLTVPNDIQASALMKTARQQITEKRTDDARETLSRIVQQYPRTDAAAAATVALIRLESDDGAKAKRELATLRSSVATTVTRLAALENSLKEIRNAPAPAPVVQQAPAPKPSPKAAPKKRPKRRHRRR
jgi:predicted negative regulator of RcsB-dependent stress response